MQPQQGYWQFVPVQPQPTVKPLQWYEYVLGYGAFAVYIAINLIVLAQQIQAGWRW